MEVIEIKTLIDVTNTDVRRIDQGTQLELDQYRNWTTLIQCIGLRSNIGYDANPTVEEVDVKGLGFGSEYKGKHRVWTFRFRPDVPGAFDSERGPAALLINDLDKVPVITKLTETINIQQAVFVTIDTTVTNTLVRRVN